MALSHLEISNLRNIKNATLEPAEKINLISGLNGSGKTATLEAIYLLGRGRSFRSAHSRRIITHDEKHLTVFGEALADGVSSRIGVQIREGKFQAKVGGVLLRRSSALVQALPLLLISADGERLIAGSPRQRRRFLDWGLFHVEPEFLNHWQRYNRALAQRNASLRRQGTNDLLSWEQQLIPMALDLDACRRRYIKQLQPHFQRLFDDLLDVKGLTLDYRQGWPEEQSYAEALLQSRSHDQKSGHTQRGPHRADLLLKVMGRKADQILSGGQQKLTACALILAQAELYNQSLERKTILLVDDLPAELDSQKRQQLMNLLNRLESQVFVTATESMLVDISDFKKSRRFHVEQGSIGVEGST